MDRKEMTRRRFLSMTAAAAAGGLAVACQPASQPTPAQAGTGAQDQATAAPPPATAAPAAQKVELRFIKLSMGDKQGAYFNDTAVPKFGETYPNIALTIDMADWGTLGEKLLTSFAGNLAVDLVETGSDWVGPYARRKQFLPIDDYVANDYQDEIKDYYPDMVDISRYMGKLMALPYTLDIRTVCYRKDHFEEAGLDPSRAPDTWDDLVAYGAKLVKTDAQGQITRAGYMMSASTPADALFEFWYLLVQNGTDVGSWDVNDVKFNGPEGLEALQFMYDLINKHKISPITGMTTTNPAVSPLGEGVTSMAANGSWEIDNWKSYQPDKIQYLGIGAPPMKKKRLHYACPNVYAIGSNTKHPDEAWTLLKFMVSTEILTEYLGSNSQSPPRRSVAEGAAYMQDPLLKAFQEIPAKGWGATTPQAVDFPTLELIGNYVQAALRDEMPLQAALDKAAEEVKAKITEALQAG